MPDRTRALARVIAIKVVITVVFWAMPLLVIWPEALGALGFPGGQSTVFLRLLGAAYASLTVTYVFGLSSLRRGRHPGATIWTGIVSNGAACLILVLDGVTGAWAPWGAPARGFMWTSAVATGLITAGLLRFGMAARAAPADGHGRSV